MKRAVIAIHGDVFIEICKNGFKPTVECCEGLPIDVKFISIVPYPSRYAEPNTYDMVDIIVESETFDEVRRGSPLPVITPKFRSGADVQKAYEETLQCQK